eukprot:gene27758-33526_t
MASRMSLSDSLMQLLSGLSAVAENSLEALVLIIHSMFLRDSFIPIVEEANPTPGFAPSTKELAKNALPPNWRADLSIQYKHRRAPGKIVSFKITQIDGNLVMLTISLRKGDYASLELNLDQYVTGEPPTPLTPCNLDDLHGKVRAVILQLVPVLQQDENPYREPLGPHPPPANPLYLPSQSFPTPYMPPYNAGAADLDPFMSQGPPHPHPFAPLPAGGALGGSGGSLVGPDHSIFRADRVYGGPGPYPHHPQPSVPFLPGMAYPTPRIDPFGPPTPFNSEVDVGDVWPEGMDPRGFFAGGRGAGRGGRGVGGGRGAGGRGWGGAGAGEPNPDHLKPPGW